MSFQLPTDLDTSAAAIPLVKDGKQQKIAGVTLHFTLLGDTSTPGTLAYAIAQEQANVAAGNPIWVDGQSLLASDEGVTRKWNAVAAHARLISLSMGKTFTLAADTNRVYINNGSLSTSLGANGDVAVVWGYLTAFLKTAGAWAFLLDFALTHYTGILYAYDTSTAEQSPMTNTFVRFNTATPATATFCYLSNFNFNNIDIGGIIGQITIGQKLRLESVLDETQFVEWAITSVAVPNNYRRFGLSLLSNGLGQYPQGAKLRLSTGPSVTTLTRDSIGAVSGIAGLDTSSLVPLAQLPASVKSLAAAPDFATSVTAPLALKAPLASPVFTGTPTATWGPLATKLSALRMAMEFAARGNYQTALPLVAAPVWASGATVYANQVITNGGNAWFVLTGGALSTTAPALPTNLADRVTNGAASLCYMGATKALAPTGPDTPTVADVNTSSGTTGMREVSPQTNGASFTFTSTSGPINHNTGVAVPGPYNASTSFYGDTSVTSLIGLVRSPSTRMGFITCSKRVIVQGGNNLANNPVNIEVNGQPIKEAGLHFTGVGPNPGGVLLTFPDRRRRVFWVGYPAGGFDYLSAWVDTAESIAPPDPGNVRLVVEGDSLTGGGNSAPYYWRGDWPSQLADHCGIRDVWNMALGGTGVIANGPAVNFANTNRIARVIAAAPQILFIAGAHNDSGSSSSARVAAMTAYLTALRAGLPYTLILVFGETMLRDEVKATFTPIDADWLTAIAAFKTAGGTYIDFIPAATASPEAWILDGAVAPYYITSGDGHPVQLGIDYLAARYTSAFQNWLAANTR